jgi:outer membrane immunogenic protein
MKTFILALSLLCVSAVGAWAMAPESEEEQRQEAAIEAKKHPSPLWGPAPTTFNWTGPYVGIQFSYTRSSTDTTTKLGGFWNEFEFKNVLEDEARHEFDEDGFGLGGCAGYNYQFQNGIVLGMGISGRKLYGLDGMHSTGDFGINEDGLFDIVQRFKTTYIVNAGPKLGYACGRIFPYATGGVAFGELDYRERILSNEFEVSEVAKGSDIRSGWFAGAGLQYALTNNWSVKVEYTYSDLGTLNLNSHGPDFNRGFAGWHNADLTEHSGNFGIVYNFYGFSPH